MARTSRTAGAAERVLLIEPDADLAELLQVGLRRAGLQVARVASARDAGGWAVAAGPVAVVVDTDGASLRETVEVLQASAGPRPLVLLSGPREPTVSARGRCRIVARLAKPVAFAELRAAVRQALEATPAP